MKLDDVTTTAAENTAPAAEAPAKKAVRKVATKPKGKKMAKKAKAKTKAKRGNAHGNAKERTDKYAASLGIHQDTARAKIVEGMCKNSGKMYTPEAIGKMSGEDWPKRKVQHFVMWRIPQKAKRRRVTNIKVLSEAGKNGQVYGLSVK
jgi:hypothetical protein